MEVTMESNKLGVIFLLLVLVFNVIYASEPARYTIDRISRNAVMQQKKVINNQKITSKKAQIAVNIGAIGLCAAAGLAAGYALYKIRHRQSPALAAGVAEQLSDTANITKLQLREEISSLRETVSNLSDKIKNGPKIGSWSWWKSCLVNFALTPTILVGLFKTVGAVGNGISKKIFFPDNCGDFIERDTQLGALTGQLNEQGIVHMSLVKGATLVELEHYAQLLDKRDTMLEKASTTGKELAIDYAKKSIVSGFNRVIADTTRLIAFMYHEADVWSFVPPLVGEVRDRARYLVHVANKTGKLLEVALNDVTVTRPITPIIKEFLNELEQVIVGYARIEYQLGVKITLHEQNRNALPHVQSALNNVDGAC